MFKSSRSQLTGRSQAAIYQLRRKAEFANVHYPIFQIFIMCTRNMHPTALSRDWAHSPLTCQSRCECCRSLHFGWEGFPWTSIPAGPKLTLSPPTAHLSSARQDLKLCLSTSSVSLWATPLSVTFLALWRAVLCAVTHCTPLAYPIPSAVWILPLKQCYKNHAVNSVQRPPPFPSPPCQASSIFSSH